MKQFIDSMHRMRTSQRFWFALLLLLSLLLVLKHSVHQPKNTMNTSKIISVESNPSVTTLNYSGYIKPINTISINNVSADGFILEKHFDYGKQIHKGQLLFVISSKQFAKNYQETLSQYIRAKKNYTDSQYQMHGVEELKKLKIISQQEYINTKTQFFNAGLDYEQASTRLKELLNELGIPQTHIQSLDNLNQELIHHVLGKPPTEISITAPADGIALIPDDGGKEGAKNPLTVGAAVKASQGLLQIGDMSGISIVVKVNQMYVDKIHEGQKATITSEAFPGVTLHGRVSYVARQAASGEMGNGIPTFEVYTLVSKIEPVVMNILRVGMSAEVEFPLEMTASIKIPLTAVFSKNGVNTVEKIDTKNHRTQMVAIETGRTEMDTVEILHGLKPGDRVVLHDRAD